MYESAGGGKPKVPPKQRIQKGKVFRPKSGAIRRRLANR